MNRPTNHRPAVSEHVERTQTQPSGCVHANSAQPDSGNSSGAEAGSGRNSHRSRVLRVRTITETQISPHLLTATANRKQPQLERGTSASEVRAAPSWHRCQPPSTRPSGTTRLTATHRISGKQRDLRPGRTRPRQQRCGQRFSSAPCGESPDFPFTCELRRSSLQDSCEMAPAATRTSSRPPPHRGPRPGLRG